MRSNQLPPLTPTKMTGRQQNRATPSSIPPSPAGKKEISRHVVTHRAIKPQPNHLKPKTLSPKKITRQTTEGATALKRTLKMNTAARKTPTPQVALKPPPAPAKINRPQSREKKPTTLKPKENPTPLITASAKPVKKTTPVSTASPRIKLDYRAPISQVKIKPEISPSPPAITKPPAIIAGELVPFKPTQQTNKQAAKLTTAKTGETKTATHPSPAPAKEALPENEKPPVDVLTQKAKQIAGSLVEEQNNLGLSVDDVLDLTKTEDNLPFIKHEPPSSSSGDINDLIISAIKQTDFDIGSSKMEFSGDVQIKSPRFAMRCDRFIVHLKKDGSGISYGEGVGNVFIRMRNNGKPSGHEGFASHAIYLPEDGKLTLSGWPKIREEQKEHVAATKETKMVLYTDGRVQTLGRNRTIINN